MDINRSKDLYRTFIDASNDMIFLKDEEGRYIVVNKHYLEYLGKKEEDVIGKTGFEFRPQDIAEHCEQSDRKTLELNDMLVTEETINNRTMETRKFPVRLGNNKVGIGCFMRDITERKQMEASLQQSEQRKAILNDIANIFLTIPDEAIYEEVLAVVLRVTRSEYGLFGYIGEDGGLVIPSLTRNVWKECKIPDKSIIFPSDTWGESLWGKAIREKKVLYSNEPFHTSEGHVHIDNFLTVPIVFRKETIGLLSVANKEGGYTEDDKNLQEGIANFISPILHARLQRDMQEQKRREVEEEIRESEERYRLLFELESDAIFLIDNETGQILEVNKAATILYGYSREELLTKNHRDMSAEPERTREATSKEMTVVPLRYHRKKDGTVFPVEITATHIIWRGRKSHLAAIRDITRREAAEKELRLTLEKLRKILGATVQAMAVTIETRDPYTAGHQRRVTNLARAIAQEMNLHNDIVDGIRVAGLVHDIGKISVPAEILSKPTKLTDIEFKLIKVHPEAGYAILKDIDFPWPVADIVLQHHERLDGSGYPQGLKDEQILLEAQILSIADVVEAMASHRPYRAGLGIDIALEEIEKNKGILYNPQAANACLRLFREKGFRFE